MIGLRDTLVSRIVYAVHGVRDHPIPVHTEDEPCAPCHAAADAVLALAEERITSERARLLADSSWVLEQSILEQVHASGYAQALTDAKAAIERCVEELSVGGISPHWISQREALAALDGLKAGQQHGAAVPERPQRDAPDTPEDERVVRGGGAA